MRLVGRTCRACRRSDILLVDHITDSTRRRQPLFYPDRDSCRYAPDPRPRAGRGIGLCPPAAAGGRVPSVNGVEWLSRSERSEPSLPPLAALPAAVRDSRLARSSPDRGAGGRWLADQLSNAQGAQPSRGRGHSHSRTAAHRCHLHDSRRSADRIRLSGQPTDLQYVTHHADAPRASPL